MAEKNSNVDDDDDVDDVDDVGDVDDRCSINLLTSFLTKCKLFFLASFFFL